MTPEERAAHRARDHEGDVLLVWTFIVILAIAGIIIGLMYLWIPIGLIAAGLALATCLHFAFKEYDD